MYQGLGLEVSQTIDAVDISATILWPGPIFSIWFVTVLAI